MCLRWDPGIHVIQKLLGGYKYDLGSRSSGVAGKVQAFESPVSGSNTSFAIYCCVILSRLMNDLTPPQGPHLYILRLSWGLNEITYVKCASRFLAHGGHSEMLVP